MNSTKFNLDLITSKTNSTVVKLSKLTNKKSRNEEKLFCLDGVKLFWEAYNFGAKIEYLIINESSVLDEKTSEIIFELKEKSRVICVNDSVFSKLTDESAPQGIITVCRYLENHNFIEVSKDILENERVMIFESVRDPGNIGTIIRNAAAFGVDRLILSSDCADIYSQKVIRATMGAIFKVKIDVVSDVCKSIEFLKNQGRRVVATTLGNNSLKLGKDPVLSRDVFIIGNEGHGISEKVINISNETMFIPMCKNTESLNASIAAAILMWEQHKYNII